MIYATCSAELCEVMPKCSVCGRRKKPNGRDSMDNGLCDRDCPGYYEVPTSGHLWPGEIARARKAQR